MSFFINALFKFDLLLPKCKQKVCRTLPLGGSTTPKHRMHIAMSWKQC